ncbi:MAG: serine/threonine protein kinase [Gemmatimonadetes bacterium]|nr:serine/threonine protein kinase [Gemmatimonadota bacterium]
MTPERWRRVQEVFLAAAALPPAERAALLAAEYGDDPALRDRVERMLAVDEEPASLLDQAPLAAASPAPAGLVGRQIGPYRIMSELGRGGMGAVYLAERTDVGKRVALKLVRGGLAAPENVERFLLERRVLSRLEHPHIAQLFDAGVAEDGTPYFAMEYVRGQPIDRYCDAHRLPVDERLALFEMACGAVAMAHAGGIVHRDLKPGNILVTDPATQETGGRVKLLDFGIAKVLEEGWGQEALTRSDVRPMTPEFAAPEQLAGGAITPATDVYALGILLYRLLCGHPVRPARGRSPGGSGERVLSAELPPLSVMAGRATGEGVERLTPEAIARVRSTTPERLRAELDGDLDRITRTALAPDPRHRYPSAVELLEDVRRFRAGLAPRAARTPGRCSRFSSCCSPARSCAGGWPLPRGRRPPPVPSRCSPSRTAVWASTATSARASSRCWARPSTGSTGCGWSSRGRCSASSPGVGAPERRRIPGWWPGASARGCT